MDRKVVGARLSRGLAFWVLLCSTAVGHAQWSPDTRLSTNEFSATLNENMARCIVASGQTVHVVWCEPTNNLTALYYRRSLDGGLTWAAETRLSATPGFDSFPALALSGSTLHLAFLRSNTTAHATSCYKHSTDAGLTWGPDIPLAPTKWWPGIAAAGSMVYVSLNTLVNGTNSEVFFRRSADNGTNWEPQQQISDAPGRSEDPAIVADGNYVHLVWNDDRDFVSGTGMAVYYRRSADNGVSWRPETALTHAPAFTYFPTLCLFGSNADVAYGDRQTGQYDIYHLQSTDCGTTWAPPQQITQTATSEFYPAIIRDGWNLHLAWTGTGCIFYQHSGNGGASWDSVVALVTQGSVPFLALAGGTVHMSFLSQRVGHPAIYYKQNPAGNPPLPTLIASGSPASTQTRSVTLSWPSLPGANYTLQTSTNLANGFTTVLQTNIPATPPTNSLTLPATNPQTCFRLRL